MKHFRQFFMEDYLESNRETQFNFAESGMMARKLSDILDVLPSSALEELISLSFADSPNWGRDDLRQLVADMHAGATQDNVLITTGTSEALFLLFRQLQPKKIALIFPAYQLLYEVPMQQGAQLINLPIHWREDGQPYYELEQWLELLKKHQPDMILINNPHNPSGLSLDTNTLQAILDVAKDLGAAVVGDEHYRFLASEHSLLGDTLYRPDQRVFVTGSYMKCLGMSGIRIGWCIGPHDTLAAMQNEKIYLTHVVSPITEWVSLKVLSEAKEALFSQARHEWKENKKAFQSFLNQQPDVVSSVPQGGLVTCMGFRGITTQDEALSFLRELEAQGLYALPLSSMELGGLCQQASAIPEPLRYGIRFGLGLEPTLFLKGLGRLSSVMSSVAL